MYGKFYGITKRHKEFNKITQTTKYCGEKINENLNKWGDTMLTFKDSVFMAEQMTVIPTLNYSNYSTISTLVYGFSQKLN